MQHRIEPHAVRVVSRQGGSGRPRRAGWMGDDIGGFNIGTYHDGITAGRTPSLDKLAAEGMRFPDYESQ